jgi:hypothetical protein
MFLKHQGFSHFPVISRESLYDCQLLGMCEQPLRVACNSRSGSLGHTMLKTFISGFSSGQQFPFYFMGEKNLSIHKGKVMQLTL